MVFEKVNVSNHGSLSSSEKMRFLKNGNRSFLTSLKYHGVLIPHNITLSRLDIMVQ